jgi:peptidoglycan/xylan/chitin deacetylase (PgdA/CDA1 family)
MKPKKLAWIGAAVCVGLLGLLVGAWRISHARCFALAGEPIYRAATSEKVVALSFDDGPTPAGTRFALDTLAHYDVRATFFLIGEAMKSHPELAPTLLEAGHELGNHSDRHARMIETYAERIVAAAEPGSIILMHIMYGANELARDALPLVIEGLHARGFSIVPTGELLDRAQAARP